MDTLFAPWRFSYLMSEKPKDCIFCNAASAPDAAGSLVVERGRRVFTILNRFPYVNGHLMVAPLAHEARLEESDPETLSELITAVARAQSVLSAVYRPAGFNVGANFGRAAGAGVESHYHFHVVPRWEGDVNFLTITAGARVVPEELSVTREKLAAGYAQEPRKEAR